MPNKSFVKRRLDGKFIWKVCEEVRQARLSLDQGFAHDDGTRVIVVLGTS